MPASDRVPWRSEPKLPENPGELNGAIEDLRQKSAGIKITPELALGNRCDVDNDCAQCSLALS